MNSNANDGFDHIEDLIDLRSVWFGLRRRAALFVSVGASIFAAVAAYAFLSTELYTAEASLMIEPHTQVFAYGSDAAGQRPADPLNVDTEVELLRSRAMALRVDQRLLEAIEGAPARQAAQIEKKKDDFFSRRLADIAADLAAIQFKDSVPVPSSPSDDASPPQEPTPEAGSADAALPDDDGATAVEGPEQPDGEPALSAGEIAADNAVAAPSEISAQGDETIESARLSAAAVTKSRNISSLMKNLEIQRVGTTFLIKIRFSDPSPNAAANIANAYAEEYILQQLEAQYDQLRQANKWIDARLSTLREEVRRADAAAAKYRADQGLIDVTGASLSEKALAGIAAQLSGARNEAASAQARYDTALRLANANAPLDSISEIMASPVISELKRQQVGVDRRLAELKVRYGDRHPEVLKTREEYAELAIQMEREKQRVFQSLRSQVEFAQAQVRSLEASLQSAQGDMASNNESLITLMELERDLDATRGVYEALLNRQKELNERDQLADANARIIARAETPESPSKPRRNLILAGGVLLGLLVAGASAFSAEALDTRVRNTSDLRREFGPNTPVVLVPRIQSRLLFRQRRHDDVVRRYLNEEPDSLFAESMRDLRMFLRAAQRDLNRAPTVAFTSVFRNEGTTTTAFAFASLLASTGKSVAFVEYPSRPGRVFRNAESIAKIAEAKRPELENVAASEALLGAGGPRPETAEQAMSLSVGDRLREIRSDSHKTGLSEIAKSRHGLETEELLCGVEVLRADDIGSRSEDMDFSDFEALVEEVRSAYDYVIIDAPSVLTKNEGSMIAASADFTVLVMEWCSTSRGAARAAAQRLLDLRAKVLSFVITKVDEKQRYYFRPEDRQFFFGKRR